MTYPVTPNPSIHSIPPAIAKKQAVANQQAIQASAKRLIDGLINSILWHLTGGLLGHNPNQDSVQTVTPSQSAPAYMQSFYNTAVVNPIPHTRIPVIPASHISNSLPNVLVGGDFANVNSVDTTTGFVWDSTNDHTGVSGSGSALLVCSGVTKSLVSPLVPVSPNDALTASGWAKWDSISVSSGVALTLSVDAYDANKTFLSSTVVYSLTASAGTGLSAAWNQFSGTFSPPGGCASVAVKVTVTSLVSAGSIWFDDLSLTKTGPIGGELVSGLTGIGSNIVADLQASLNSIGRAIFGGLGSHSPDSIKNALLQIPFENITIIPNPSSTGVAFDAAGTGWTTATGLNTSLSITGSHTATGNVVIVALTYQVVGAAANTAGYYSRTVTYGTTSPMTMGSLGLVYKSQGGYAGFNNYTATVTELFGLFNPPPGAQTITATVAGSSVYALRGTSMSYSGVTALGSPTTVNGSNGSPSMTVASLSTSNVVVQGFFVVSANLTAQTLTAYNKTQRFNSGSVATGYPFAAVDGDSVSGASVTFSATSSYTTNYWGGIAIELKSNSGFLGSGFRAAHAPNPMTTASVSSGDNLAPTSFFSSEYTGNTSDYIYSTATNKLTVAYSGWYSVKISYTLVSGLLGTPTICPILYQNGFVVQYGQTFVYPYNSNVVQRSADTFFLYLNAGDYVQPGYNCNTATSNFLTGDIYSTKSYWSVTLVNRSLT